MMKTLTRFLKVMVLGCVGFVGIVATVRWLNRVPDNVPYHEPPPSPLVQYEHFWVYYYGGSFKQQPCAMVLRSEEQRPVRFVAFTAPSNEVPNPLDADGFVWQPNVPIGTFNSLSDAVDVIKENYCASDLGMWAAYEKTVHH
jgi:hypothetical protein